MERSTAINLAYRLHIEWISEKEIMAGKGFDLDHIHAVLTQENQWNKRQPKRVSTANARETRGKLILLGKIKKSLGHVAGQKYGGIA